MIVVQTSPLIVHRYLLTFLFLYICSMCYPSQRTRYRRCSHRALYLSLIHLILAGTVCSFLLQHSTLLYTPETRYLLKRQQKNDFVHAPGREHTSVTTKCQRE